MLHHIEIYVSNLEKSCKYWSELLNNIGYAKTAHWDGGFTLAIGDEAYLTFVQVEERHASKNYHRSGVGLNHLAFKVKDRDAVDALRAYCLEQDIPSLYDDRYPFANGGSDYYALFIEDPDRIKVEFVAS
ncbi:catechol 2,3-dioxygenase-like lactoylglutathione lyase family enzyme [Rhizobium sp. PP-F2F-G48]|uniref:VOC family protein n=1 Tax=Rhizobium sp. PP-F2F-G48 TaxID=2135651 RepID=UPI0010517B29|nr:VOC family protein [Rhizobium sp. PP-F2F-G48]TCM51032.1 catechol 2,3-dioxygenase-like lactoylglutathione lyase family enzyme [Rhizobium sp. PP-F2F-G48]